MKAIYLVGVSALAWLAMATPAHAFGLSPAVLRADNLVPGSHYEQEVIISNGSSNLDSKVKVKFNVPGAEDWITIDRGNDFKFDANNKSETVVVGVDVPAGADIGKYTGNISFEVVPEAKDSNNGQVSVNFGGQLAVELNVGSKTVTGFEIKEVKVADLEVGGHFWFINYPGIIKTDLLIENTGNVAVAPDKMILKIFNANETSLVETISTDNIATVKAFATDWSAAEFKTLLPAGSYWATYEIYQGEKIIKTDKIHLSIMDAGKIADYTGANIFDAGWQDLTLAGVIVLVILAGLIWGIIALVNARR